MTAQADIQHEDPFGIVGTVQARVFHVEKAVAEGGFGVVYRAQHEVFRAPVALKCLKLPENLTEEQKTEFLERFRAEAELLFRLSAALPEVVRPLQFGVLDTASLVPFLALEWLEGQTLDGFVADRASKGQAPIPLSAALDVVGPVARVLSRAHQFSDRGKDVTIIHRDVKPENVFLAEVDGERMTRILDFGIARVRAATSAIAGHATGTDVLKAFSPAYAAPEQWSPETYGGPGPWTDVYGLALTLTEVLIGRAPIFGDLTAMMGAALDPELRPTPRNRGAKVTDNVERAFQKALAVDPRQRTQTIEGFWTQLEIAAGRSPSITRRLGTSPSLLSAVPTPELELALPDIAPPSAPAVAPPAQASPPSAGVHMVAPLRERAPAPLELAPVLEVERPVASRPRPVRRDVGPGAGVWVSPRDRAPTRSFAEKFSGPAWLIVLALAVGGAEIVWMRVTGERLNLPVRPLYIAGPLGIIGLVLVLIRLFED
ncbi:MAG: serine/threonine protein kinase [Polyangiaceae bacterium]|nr:serine/threonine protein kinase [Polyangiaceae bacterium]